MHIATVFFKCKIIGKGNRKSHYKTTNRNLKEYNSSS